MCKVSARELLFWIQKITNRYGDNDSLYLLLDLEGGISKRDLNSIKISPVSNIELKKSLYNLELMWEDHIQNNTPIQYLCQKTYWRDFELEVSKNVLIPRVETEQLIEISLNICPNKENILFADLGTGSGAIGIALAVKKPSWKGFCTDIDKNAIEIARKNFKRISKNTNLDFYCGNWWEPLLDFAGNIDIAISNPPYIPNDLYENLSLSVKNFEPKISLTGGNDGLIHIRKIIQDAPEFLKKGGWLILENHFDQGHEIKNLFLRNGFGSIKIIKDYFGIGRFTIGRYK